MGYLVMSNLSDTIKETSTKRENSEGGGFGLFRKMEGEVLLVKKWVPLFQWLDENRGNMRGRNGTEAGMRQRYHGLLFILFCTTQSTMKHV